MLKYVESYNRIHKKICNFNTLLTVLKLKG